MIYFKSVLVVLPVEIFRIFTSKGFDKNRYISSSLFHDTKTGSKFRVAMQKVSVVILNWNGEHFLKKFLPSVVEKSKIPSVEVVVADNGSTDGSIALLEKDFPSVKSEQIINFFKSDLEQ